MKKETKEKIKILIEKYERVKNAGRFLKIPINGIQLNPKSKEPTKKSTKKTMNYMN